MEIHPQHSSWRGGLKIFLCKTALSDRKLTLTKEQLCAGSKKGMANPHVSGFRTYFFEPSNIVYSEPIKEFILFCRFLYFIKVLVDKVKKPLLQMMLVL